jgi:PKD repeat protein
LVTGGFQPKNDTDVFVLKLDVVCTPTEPVLWTSVGDREVVLGWTPPEVGAETVLRYDIYRGPSPARLQKFVSMDGGARTAHDRMVQNGQIYFYAILAVNSSGDGAMSGSVQAMPGLPPTEPWGLAARAGPGIVRLSWQAPNRTYDLPVLTYKIYRWRSFMGEMSTVFSQADKLEFCDTWAANDVLFYYEVSAVTKMGEGPRSDPVSATPSGFPSPPPGFSANVIGRQAVLGWNVPQNPGSYPVLYYNIYRRIEGDRERLYANASATMYMSQRLPAGTYYFRVAAVSAMGVGYRTDEVAVTILNQPPRASVTAEPTRGKSTTQFNFTPNALDPDGLIANYSWSFGDGGIAFKEDPFHSYKRRGSYNITLRVADDDGAVTISNITVEVLNTPPKITFPDPPADVSLEAGEKGGFEVLPVDPDEDALHVTWYLDDGTAGEGSHYSVSFKKEGLHRIRAVVDDGQDSDEHVWTVTVKQAPSPPSPSVNYYVIGLVSAAIVAAGGLLLGRRIGQGRMKRTSATARGSGRPRGSTPRRQPGRKVKKQRVAGGQSKRIL